MISLELKKSNIFLNCGCISGDFVQFWSWFVLSWLYLGMFTSSIYICPIDGVFVWLRFEELVLEIVRRRNQFMDGREHEGCEESRSWDKHERCECGVHYHTCKGRRVYDHAHYPLGWIFRSFLITRGIRWNLDRSSWSSEWQALTRESRWILELLGKFIRWHIASVQR